MASWNSRRLRREKGGKFAPKGQGGETDAPAPEAAANAAAATRDSTSVAHSSTNLADGEHENIWQTFDSYLSHEAKSALAQIGQAEVTESYNNLAIAVDERNAIARTLRDYANYRAQLLLDSAGRPVEIPAIDIGNPVAGPAELMIRLTAHERLTRPAINADWIDPLFNLASATGAGVPFRFAGPAAEILDSAGLAELSANSAEYAEGSFSVPDWSGYPADLSRPTGPFKLLNGEEYDAARTAANSANRTLREADPTVYAGKQIHEIHPVKFGGSPMDPANKIALTPAQHAAATTWWNQLLRNLSRRSK